MVTKAVYRRIARHMDTTVVRYMERVEGERREGDGGEEEAVKWERMAGWPLILRPQGQRVTGEYEHLIRVDVYACTARSNE